IFVRLWKEQEGESSGRRLGPYQALAEQDYAVRVPLEGLEPDTVFRFDTTFRQRGDGQEMEAMDGDGTIGRFRTAPDPATHRDVSFVFSGDLGGGGYCRRVDAGYATFDAMSRA